MSYEMEAIQESVIQSNAPADLPVKEFSPYGRSASPMKGKNEGQRTNSVEAPTAESLSAPTESVRLSPHLSALARKESAVRAKEQALRERERQLEARLADSDKFNQIKTKIASKDLSAAEELGVTYEDYTKYLTDKLRDSDPQTQAVKEIRDELESLKKNQEENVDRQFDANVAEYRKAISQLVENPEYAAIKRLKGENHVLQYILDSFEEDNIQLSVDEAARDVLAMFKANKEELSNAFNEERSAQARTLPPPKMGAKTLTQQVTTGSERPSLKPLSQMNDAERWAEARRRVEARKLKQG